MADLTITIPAPILTTGQYFKVRYRQLPSGTWSAQSNHTNAAFSLTGLSVGEYEFEFILVKADDTHCPPVYRTYTLVGEFECISFASTMVKVNGLYYLDITYALPPGYTDPPCGWEIKYYPYNGPALTLPYAALPTSGQIRVLVQNTSGSLYITANLCNGKTKQCHVNDITSIPDAPCEPMTVNPTALLTQTGGQWYLTVYFTQSAPVTTQVFIAFNQYGVGAAGPTPRQFTTLTISPSSASVTFPLQAPPGWVAGTQKIYYHGYIVDICGQGSAFNAEYVL